MLFDALLHTKHWFLELRKRHFQASRFSNISGDPHKKLGPLTLEVRFTGFSTTTRSFYSSSYAPALKHLMRPLSAGKHLYYPWLTEIIAEHQFSILAVGPLI